MTKALLLPFYCEGYDRNLFTAQVRSIGETLNAFGLSVTLREPIGTFDEAVKVQKDENALAYDLAVLIPATWSEPRLASVAARGFFGRPILILAINEFMLNGRRTEFSSAPAAAALYGSLTEMGVPAVFLPGPLKENEAKIKAVARAAETLAFLRTARMGAVGHNFNGITAAGLDLSLLRRKFGTEVYSVDGSTVIRTAESLPADSALYKRAEREIMAAYQGIPEDYLEKVVRITAALFSLIDEYKLDALEVRCHTEFSMEYGLSMCLPLGIVGNHVAAACEADLAVLFTELVFRSLSGGKTPTYADLRTFTKDGMDAGACGFAPTSLTGSLGKAAGENGYLTNSSDLNEGTLTLGRLLKRPGGVLAFHAARGKAEKIANRLTEYGCAPYPMARIKPEGSMEEFIRNTGANHYAIVYEDVLDALTEFAFWAGVELL